MKTKGRSKNEHLNTSSQRPCNHTSTHWRRVHHSSGAGNTFGNPVARAQCRRRSGPVRPRLDRTRSVAPRLLARQPADQRTRHWAGRRVHARRLLAQRASGHRRRDRRFSELQTHIRRCRALDLTVLLVLSPLGVLWAGIFTMDLLALHTLGTLVAFCTPVIAFPIVGLVLRHVPEWKRFGTWMLLGCLLTLALLVGFTTSVPPHINWATGGGSLGLWQRALGIEVQAWFVAMGVLAFRRASRSAGL